MLTLSCVDDGCELLLWAAAEIGASIMACCIPMLRALFFDVHPKSSYIRQNGSYTSGRNSRNVGGGHHPSMRNNSTSSEAWSAAAAPLVLDVVLPSLLSVKDGNDFRDNGGAGYAALKTLSTAA